MQRFMNRQWGPLIVLTTLVTAGCAGQGGVDTVGDRTTNRTSAVSDGAGNLSSPNDDARSTGTEVTLVLANPLMDMPDQLITWAAEVRRATDKSITFEVVSEYGVAGGRDDREQQVLDDVASGKVDLAWVGARSLPSFEVLLAPMLVDSHELQARVFAAGIPARMLADLGIDGVTGLGVLPGPHRRVLGVSTDFRAPEDFAGAVVMSDQNAVTVDTLLTLGVAESVQGVEGGDLAGLDGVVAHAGAVVGNSYQMTAKSISTNLNLWPRPLVLVANTAVLEGLSAEHRDALLSAAEDTLEAQMELTKGEDTLRADARALLCDSPVELVELTEAELAAMAEAVRPVLDELAADARNAAYLGEIRQLKHQVSVPPDAFRCEDTS